MLPKAGGLSTEGLFWACSLAAQVSLQLFLLIPDALHMSEVILPCWDSFTLGIAVLGLNLAAPRQHFPNCFLLPSAPVPLCSSVLCFGTSPASLGQASKDLGLGWGDSMPSPAEGTELLPSPAGNSHVPSLLSTPATSNYSCLWLPHCSGALPFHSSFLPPFWVLSLCWFKQLHLKKTRSL